MITPNELFEKSNRLFNKVMTAILKDENIFPLIIPSNKKLSGTNFSELKASIIPLYHQSKQVKGKGYTIEWIEKKVEGTKQKIPSKIFFETHEDYLYYTKRTKDYEAIKKCYTKITSSFPSLMDWAKNEGIFLLSQDSSIDDLLKVCDYFRNNKPPHNLYLRELPIEVHSKFIEDNSPALRKMLDVLLPADWINENVTDFSGRYGVKKPNIYAQIRILDDNLKPVIGFDEMALTLEDAALLNWQPSKVFIIENKACFLSFPKIQNAVAIFGEGFKSRISKHIPWLHNVTLYCWFDLDAAGFEMLNMVRDFYPNARSFLMDNHTFESFKQFSVFSPFKKRNLPLLSSEEADLYQKLISHSVRLEQEKITQQYVLKELAERIHKQK